MADHRSTPPETTNLVGRLAQPAPGPNVVAFADAGQWWLVNLGHAPAFDVTAVDELDTAVARVACLEPGAQHVIAPPEPHGAGVRRITVTVCWTSAAGNSDTAVYELAANGWRPGRR